MLTSPLRIWLSDFDHGDDTKRAADLESMAQLIEDSMPNLKHEAEKRFYRGLAKNYRTVAQGILRRRHRT